MESLYTTISTSKNCQVRLRWIRLGLRLHYEPSIENALAMVTEQGRMKLVRPLYRDLYEWEAARSKAIATFTKNRPNMHNTTASLVAKDLHL